ncbi:MAG: hypothetical protein N3A38_05075 [Planctomycetota bacterium]|nr:hypothetical protein [Planctomycetota bacterium]
MSSGSARGSGRGEPGGAKGADGGAGRSARGARRAVPRRRGGGLSAAGAIVLVAAIVVAALGGYWLYSGGMIAGTPPRLNREYLLRYLEFEKWMDREGLATHTMDQVRKKYDSLPIGKTTDDDIKRLHEKTWQLIEVRDKYKVPIIEAGKETPENVKARKEAADALRKAEEPLKNEVRAIRERVFKRYGVIEVE